jgi:hypothetical protein
MRTARKKLMAGQLVAGLRQSGGLSPWRRSWFLRARCRWADGSPPAWTTTKSLAVASLVVGFMSLMLLFFAGIGTFFAPLGAFLGALALRRGVGVDRQAG